MPIDTRAIDELRAEIAAGNRRRDWLLFGGLLVLGGVLWLGLGLDPAWVGWTSLGGGAGALLAARFRPAR